MTAPDKFDLDLGDGHWLKFSRWAPDRTIESNATRFAGVPDEPRFGAMVPHLKADGSMCDGFITFDGDVQRRVHPGAAKWTVEQWEPLTLSPSLLCHCGDHGYIRGGRWVKC
jgi:hypothetical protein